MTTGDEVSTTPVNALGLVRDSIGPVAATFAAAAGYRLTTVEHRSDAQVGRGLGGDGGADVTFVVGGTGRGIADHLRGLLNELSADVIVDGVRCRPGGSQIVAILSGGHVVVGLPGNPLAAVLAMMITGRAVADALLGVDRVPMSGVLSTPSPPSQHSRIAPARRRPDGTWDVMPHPRTAHLAGLIGADGLVIVSSEPRAPVEVIPLPTV